MEGGAARPPPYRRLHRNEYTASASARPPPPRGDDVPVCSCRPQDGCGEGCLNRALYVECDRASCPAGDGCGNQRMQRRQAARTALLATPGRGWGLAAAEAVAEGGFVGEYLGEVVSTAEARRRAAATEAGGGDKHFYFMSLKARESRQASGRGGGGPVGAPASPVLPP